MNIKAIKAIRIHFYKHEVMILNIVAAIILIVDGFDYFNASLNFFRLLWSSVCIAATIFIDCCQQNVFKELAHKRVADRKSVV